MQRKGDVNTWLKLGDVVEGFTEMTMEKTFPFRAGKMLRFTAPVPKDPGPAYNTRDQKKGEKEDRKYAGKY